MRRFFVLGGLVVWLGGPSAVHAHGGFAETNSFTSRRGHPEEMLAGFTQGALLSRDHGQTWSWVCTEAIGYGAWIPERYTWAANGDLLAATGDTLVRSRDGGCTWSKSTAFSDLWVLSLAEHPTLDTVLYATTGRPSVSNALYRSEDSGETWTPTTLQREAVFTSVLLAPSRPERLYVSGSEGYGLYLFRSDDAGATWTELALSLPAGLEGAYDLKLLAVSPVQPDVLWARVSTVSDVGSVNGTVLRSDDGGQSFTVALAQGDPLVNMDVSADGRTTWVATYNHLYRAHEGEPFTLLPLPNGNACVTRQADGLYACGSTWIHDWALARSLDEGTSWQPLLNLRELRGVADCPAGTPVHDLCTPLWPQMAQQLGMTSPTGGTDAGVPETPADPSTPSKPRGCAATGGGVALPGAWLVWAGRRRRRAARRA